MTGSIVSVVITTYNYGAFVEQAIESVLAQDFPVGQLEVILVDDGSTDDTGSRIQKYNHRIKYLYKANGGQASALNVGFAAATGEIIALLDADDTFMPNKISRIVEAFRGNPEVGMIYHRLEEWHVRTNERRDWEFFPESGDLRKDPEKFLRYVPQPTSCISFRRSALEMLLPIPEEIRMLADCYVVALIPFVAPILALPEILSTYRIHGKNSYTSGEEQFSEETQANRLRMWQVVIGAMSKWLGAHGHTLAQANTRAFIGRWTTILEREEFAIRSPGRVVFFRHLLRTYRYQLHLMTWKLWLINYFNAVASLFLGYKKFALLGQYQQRFVRHLHSVFGGRGNQPQ